MAPDLSTFRFVKDDGGRAAAGFRGKARDCAARAIAKTTGLPYRTIWDDIAAARKQSGIDLGMKLRVSADHGINSHREWFHRYMKQLGFRRVIPRTKMKFCADDLPMKGRLVVVLS